MYVPPDLGDSFYFLFSCIFKPVLHLPQQLLGLLYDQSVWVELQSDTALVFFFLLVGRFLLVLLLVFRSITCFLLCRMLRFHVAQYTPCFGSFGCYQQTILHTSQQFHHFLFLNSVVSCFTSLLSDYNSTIFQICELLCFFFFNQERNFFFPPLLLP